MSSLPPHGLFLMSLWFIWLSRWIPRRCWDISHCEWDKPRESMLTRSVSTRKLWNQYHLNPNPFSHHDRFFLCPQMPWKHSCVASTLELSWQCSYFSGGWWCWWPCIELVVLLAWCCGTRKECPKCHPSTMQAALAALSAAWPSSTGCRTLTRAVFLWTTARTS